MRFFDIHTHGIGGFDTQTTDPEDILKVAEIQGSRGVHAILPAVYSGPIEGMRGNLRALRGAMERQLLSDGQRATGGEEQISGKPNTEKGQGRPRRPDDTAPAASCAARPATILGAYLEGPFLNPLRAGALDGSSFLVPSACDLDLLLDGFEDIVKVVVVAPELPGALTLTRALADLGIRVSMGHSDATFAEAEGGFKAGATGVTHLFNAMRPFHHREPGLAGFGLMHPEVYVEVIADPFHLHESLLRLIFAAKSPDRILLVSDSVKATAQEPSTGGIRDGEGRLSGGSLALPEAADRLLRLGYDRERIGKAAALNPRRYLHPATPPPR